MRSFPLILLCLCAMSVVSTASDTISEPGLTSRIATLALTAMPSDVASGLPGSGVDVLARLQSPPVIAADSSSEQLVAVFGQVRDHIASPELLASAARCVVALSFPGEATDAWSNFRSAVALRTTADELDPATSRNAVSDPAAYVSALRASSEALRRQVLEAVQASDSVKLTQLRKKAAASAVYAVSDVWTALLQIQSPSAKASANAPKVDAADVVAVQPDRPVTNSTPKVSSGSKSSAKVSVVTPAIGTVICNKDSKKFHREGCRFLPALPNQMRLPSRNEALRQGFEPCKVCRP